MLKNVGVGQSTLWRGSAIWLCIGIFFFGACVLPRSGTLPTECTAAIECDDNEPCTSETCNDSGVCEYVVLDTDLPQTKGDCKSSACVDGKTVVSIEDGDLPDDDNPCTSDSCEEGVASNVSKSDGESCQVNGNSGVCLDGSCEVACDSSNAAERCDDDNVCTTDSCDLSSGKCVHTPLDNVPVPGESQVAGDCQQLLCDNGAKEPLTLIDNSDVPFDANDCTDDLCTEGIPSNPNRAIDVSCSDSSDSLAQVCDGNGACVQCNSANQCSHLPQDDDCQTRTCSAQGVCGQDFAAVGVLVNLSLQTSGDCKKVVCDGSGGQVQENDNGDTPFDNNDCTDDVCTNGSPSNPNKSQGTMCGNNNSVCNAAGQCVGCNSPADCSGSDTFCQVRTCINQSCGVQNTPNNTSLPKPDQTDGDCQELRCNGQGGVKSVAINDPFDDSNQCTTDSCNSGTPVNQNSAVNTNCNQNNGQFCDGSGSCVECNQASQCSGAGDCQLDVCNAQNNCQIDNEPLNTPAPPSYQTTGDCQLVVCDGQGGTTSQDQNIDLPVDNNDCTEDKCTNGAPSNPNEPSGTTCAGGVCNGLGICAECVDDSTCASNESCDLSTFSCKLKQGEICSVAADCITSQCVDGFCCDGVCNGTCEHCGLAGLQGSCSAVPSGQDTGNDCPGGQVCNGAKVCKSEDGQSCSGASECLSNFCVDGVCCDNDCAGTCERCNAGNVGQCQAVAVGTDPDNECSGTDVCNGAGNCRCSDTAQNGSETDVDCGGSDCPACADGDMCLNPSDCQSGVCTAGTCAAASCGDGVVNGAEVCDPQDPSTPCCDSITCAGPAAMGTLCGLDPDGSACGAAPTCDGVGSGASNCQANTELNGTMCTDDGSFCTGAETCQGGVCTSAGNPCPGPDGDVDCQESCDEMNNNCAANDPDGSSCVGMKSCQGGVCI